MSLINQTREENNVNDHPITPYTDLTSDLVSHTSTHKDIIDDILIIPDSPASFPEA